MAGQFMSPEGDLEKIFVDDYAMIDQYAKTGSLWNWGSNFAGQLGDNTTANKSSPVQTIAGGTNWNQLSLGKYATYSIKTDGTLWTWGYNYRGELGDNSRVNKSSPVQTIAGGTNWKQVSAGTDQCMAIKTDGTLWAWGANFGGALGDNTTAHKSSPVQTIAGGTNWKQVSAGNRNIGAIKTDGTLWTWGANYGGALGDNTTVSKSSPIQTIAGGTNWKQVSAGQNFMGAIKTDGTLWMWGSGGFGQLGNNVASDKASPVQTIAGGTNWKQVSCGGAHTAAIKTNGTLWVWGFNDGGILGDNTNTNKSSPVQTISAGTNWKQVSTGAYSSAAIKTDGTLWMWGQNSYGLLGDNTLVNKSTPVQTVSGGTNWKQVATGYRRTSGIYFYDAGNLYPSA